MATKLYNSHLTNIMTNCKEYYILDTYIALVHISQEVNSKYIIETYSESKKNLVNILKKYINVTSKTILKCVDKLLERNILVYNYSLSAWVLVDMEHMTQTKSYDFENYSESKKFSGYVKIRKFFFSQEFSAMKAREKRILICLAQMADSKARKFYKDFSMNLLKPNSIWLKVLNTKNKYYAKYTIENMIKKYKGLFIDNSEEKREKDIAPSKNKAFKFYFHCEVIKNSPKDNDVMELVKSTNKKEYELIKNKIDFAEVTLSKQKIMHLIRSIANIKEWFLKERVVQLIVNKFRAIQVHRSREAIKSLPAYASCVVKSVMEEYKNLKTTMELNSLHSYELEEYF
ncbi:hypothetical protein [Clostridium tarantellae]|uniref:Uncharacterized protein n=1 Tax=Clostridium tarantellae TaxID=39493 RepID=A0A6I1MUA0_9CLOT|nr:hypothetical protein [Clostridium tarantellae]MPQ43809.1 hypothetical protein [Clostridium tarantellae]